MRMLSCEKPWFLRKVITELGFSRVLKRTCLWLKYLRADSCVKPKLLMRKDTANGCVIDSDSDVVIVVQNLVSEIGNENFGVVVIRPETAL